MLIGVQAQPVAAQRRHDALRRGLAHAERIADRQHHVAHAQPLSGASTAVGRLRRLPSLSTARSVSGSAPTTWRCPCDRRPAPPRWPGRLHHVIIGQHEAVLAHDHARAQAGGGLAEAGAGHVAEQLAQDGIVRQGISGTFTSLVVDVDHGRRGAGHAIRIDASAARASPAARRAPRLDGAAAGPASRSRSGRKVVTTNRIPRQTVTA